VPDQASGLRPQEWKTAQSGKVSGEDWGVSAPHLTVDIAFTSASRSRLHDFGDAGMRGTGQQLNPSHLAPPRMVVREEPAYEKTPGSLDP
jgi:hypothetical protein